MREARVHRCAWASWCCVACVAFANAARGGAAELPPGLDEVVVAVRAPGTDPHWYANFGYWSSNAEQMMYGKDGGRVCAVDVKTKACRVLLDDPLGGVRDTSVSHDGTRILFSYRKGGARNYHLYEMRADGSGLRQLTSGPYDDIEAAYLPGGDIVFCSSRCHRWVSCWHTQVAIMYRMDAGGGDLRPISCSNEHDNTPAVMPDGRLLFTRWEYIDRNQVTFHHLWTVNPDGTGQMAYFGNMHPGIVMIDAKPIPGTDKVAAIFSPGHGITEHLGALTVLDCKAGPDERGRARNVPGSPGHVRDPYPLSERFFLVAQRHALLLVDAQAGRRTELYALSDGDRAAGFELHEPWPLAPRPRERVIPDRVDRSRPAGRLVLQDVTRGRAMEGVEPGEIAKLLVIESLPKPANFSGGPEVLSWLGTFTLERILGTVPVEPDGSAYFELPADRPVFFVALDANDLAVKRMQSFTSVMPGETTGCVGCHEQRTRAPENRGAPLLAALKAPPSAVTPIEGIPDVVDFPRDIQPILDARCAGCHNDKDRRGDVVLTRGRGITFSHAYWTLIMRNQVADGGNGFGNRPPRTIGSSASALMRKIDGSHHGVTLPENERRTIWAWIETGATYAGTYAALGTGVVPAGGAMRAVHEVFGRRCSACHALPNQDAAGKILIPAPPRNGPNHQRVILENDPAARLGMEILFDFSDPAASSVLLGPLARAAGGWGTCNGAVLRLTRPSERAAENPSPVFADTNDPDYRKILAAIEKAGEYLRSGECFDMPGFRPNPHYVREMRRFGILPSAPDPARDTFDGYALDRAFWESLWYRPPVAATAMDEAGQ